MEEFLACYVADKLCSMRCTVRLVTLQALSFTPFMGLSLPPFTSSPLPSHYILPSPLLSSSSLSFSSDSSLPLEIGPLNTARGPGECCKLPSCVCGRSQQKANLVHFSLKVWQVGNNSFTGGHYCYEYLLLSNFTELELLTNIEANIGGAKCIVAHPTKLLVAHLAHVAAPPSMKWRRLPPPPTLCDVLISVAVHWSFLVNVIHYF